MRENVIIDQAMQDGITASRLNISDHLKLALGNRLAELFPACSVYLSPQQQGVDTPAVFVSFYNLANGKRIGRLSEYEFGVEIAYLARSELDQTELWGAVFLIEQQISAVDSEIGGFTCYDKNGEVLENTAQVTAAFRADELTVDDGELITKAEKELKLW
ncbi:hypothetical protein H8711_05860 [Clostridiaceae bacterium NSJ-31]|uniref:Uncharacterized protein n=1 Tax=Ligaoa zhengdingensis TaxID=2763658 RepID=A0A926DW42_9FIRM|nr:hypothetical protein [Ligaoa zhengdingensis]MBC8546458.1 hypothetical protein [Ligaoa zhengdingensis]